MRRSPSSFEYPLIICAPVRKWSTGIDATSSTTAAFGQKLIQWKVFSRPFKAAKLSALSCLLETVDASITGSGAAKNGGRRDIQHTVADLMATATAITSNLVKSWLWMMTVETSPLT